MCFHYISSMYSPESHLSVVCFGCFRQQLLASRRSFSRYDHARCLTTIKHLHCVERRSYRAHRVFPQLLDELADIDTAWVEPEEGS